MHICKWMEAVLYDMCNKVLCVLRTRWYGKLEPGGMVNSEGWHHSRRWMWFNGICSRKKILKSVKVWKIKVEFRKVNRKWVIRWTNDLFVFWCNYASTFYAIGGWAKSDVINPSPQAFELEDRDLKIEILIIDVIVGGLHDWVLPPFFVSSSSYYSYPSFTTLACTCEAGEAPPLLISGGKHS